MPRNQTGADRQDSHEGGCTGTDSTREIEQLLAMASHYCKADAKDCLDDALPASPILQALHTACDGCLQASREARRSFQSYTDNRRRQRELLAELLSLLDMTIKGAVLGDEMHSGQKKGEATRPVPVVCKDAVQAVLQVLQESADETMACDDSPPASVRIAEPCARATTVSPVAVMEVFDDKRRTSPVEIASPSLSVYLLSDFQVLLDGEPVHGWPNCRGKSVFKYLVTHRTRPIPKEVLMNTFWPDADPDAARNNLNVAVYGLRKILAGVNPSFSYVLFQGDHYLLNPALHVWVDSEAFAAHVARAREADRARATPDAISEYCAAEKIYQSELLVEDRYEEWLVDLRRQFQDMYLHALERLSQYWFDSADFESCISACTKILRVDPCFEGAHRRMMRCYSRLGQPHISVRQYRYCVEALGRELNLAPSAETISLYRALRSGVLI